MERPKHSYLVAVGARVVADSRLKGNTGLSYSEITSSLFITMRRGNLSVIEINPKCLGC